MKAKKKAKLNLFTVLGWLVWKILAIFGSRYAKTKLSDRRQQDDTTRTGLLNRVVTAVKNRRSVH